MLLRATRLDLTDKLNSVFIKEKLDYLYPFCQSFSKYAWGNCKAATNWFENKKNLASEFWTEMFSNTKNLNCPILYRRTRSFEKPPRVLVSPNQALLGEDCHGMPPRRRSAGRRLPCFLQRPNSTNLTTSPGYRPTSHSPPPFGFRHGTGFPHWPAPLTTKNFLISASKQLT
jgi:hypothetical protein